MRPTIFHSKLNFSSKFSFYYANPLATLCEIVGSSDGQNDRCSACKFIADL